MLIVSPKGLTHSYDKVPSTRDRSDSLGIEMGHHLRCAFNYRVPRSKLPCTVLAPTVQESLFRQGDAISVTNRNHTCLTSYLLNAVWRQELAEST